MSEKPKKLGRPQRKLTPDVIEYARSVLGECCRPGVAADRICQKFKVGRPKAYEALDLARHDALNDLKASGQSRDPLVLVYLFLESIMADERATTEHRLAASNQIVRLLGLDRIARHFGSEGTSVDEFIAGVMARQASLEAATSAN